MSYKRFRHITNENLITVVGDYINEEIDKLDPQIEFDEKFYSKYFNLDNIDGDGFLFFESGTLLYNYLSFSSFYKHLNSKFKDKYPSIPSLLDNLDWDEDKDKVIKSLNKIIDNLFMQNVILEAYEGVEFLNKDFVKILEKKDLSIMDRRYRGRWLLEEILPVKIYNGGNLLEIKNSEYLRAMFLGKGTYTDMIYTMKYLGLDISIDTGDNVIYDSGFNYETQERSIRNTLQKYRDESKLVDGTFREYKTRTDEIYTILNKKENDINFIDGYKDLCLYPDDSITDTFIRDIDEPYDINSTITSGGNKNIFDSNRLNSSSSSKPSSGSSNQNSNSSNSNNGMTPPSRDGLGSNESYNSSTSSSSTQDKNSNKNYDDIWSNKDSNDHDDDSGFILDNILSGSTDKDSGNDIFDKVVEQKEKETINSGNIDLNLNIYPQTNEFKGLFTTDMESIIGSVIGSNMSSGVKLENIYCNALLYDNFPYDTHEFVSRLLEIDLEYNFKVDDDPYIIRDYNFVDCNLSFNVEPWVLSNSCVNVINNEFDRKMNNDSMERVYINSFISFQDIDKSKSDDLFSSNIKDIQTHSYPIYRYVNNTLTNRFVNNDIDDLLTNGLDILEKTDISVSNGKTIEVSFINGFRVNNSYGVKYFDTDFLVDNSDPIKVKNETINDFFVAYNSFTSEVDSVNDFLDRGIIESYGEYLNADYYLLSKKDYISKIDYTYKNTEFIDIGYSIYVNNGADNVVSNTSVKSISDRDNEIFTIQTGYSYNSTYDNKVSDKDNINIDFQIPETIDLYPTVNNYDIVSRSVNNENSYFVSNTQSIEENFYEYHPNIRLSDSLPKNIFISDTGYSYVNNNSAILLSNTDIKLWDDCIRKVAYGYKSIYNHDKLDIVNIPYMTRNLVDNYHKRVREKVLEKQYEYIFTDTNRLIDFDKFVNNISLDNKVNNLVEKLISNHNSNERLEIKRDIIQSDEFYSRVDDLIRTDTDRRFIFKEGFDFYRMINNDSIYNINNLEEIFVQNRSQINDSIKIIYDKDDEYNDDSLFIKNDKKVFVSNHDNKVVDNTTQYENYGFSLAPDFESKDIKGFNFIDEFDKESSDTFEMNSNLSIIDEKSMYETINNEEDKSKVIDNKYAEKLDNSLDIGFDKLPIVVNEDISLNPEYYKNKSIEKSIIDNYNKDIEDLLYMINKSSIIDKYDIDIMDRYKLEVLKKFISNYNYNNEDSTTIDQDYNIRDIRKIYETISNKINKLLNNEEETLVSNNISIADDTLEIIKLEE